MIAGLLGVAIILVVLITLLLAIHDGHNIFPPE